MRVCCQISETHVDVRQCLAPGWSGYTLTRVYEDSRSEISMSIVLVFLDAGHFVPAEAERVHACLGIRCCG